MERNRKDRNGGVLDTVAELFDLPADLVAGLPHLEMMGSRQLYLEHHTDSLHVLEVVFLKRCVRTYLTQKLFYPTGL